MKKKVSIILVCLIWMASSMYAEVSNGTCGEQVYWEYNDSTQVLRIYGNGAITEKSYPYTAKRLEIEEGVTSVCTAGKYLKKIPPFFAKREISPARCKQYTSVPSVPR